MIKLQKTKLWLETIFEASRDAIFITDQKANLIMVNKAACILTGYSKQELTKMTIYDLHKPKDLTAHELYYEKVINDEGFRNEAKIIRKDGLEVNTEINNQTFFMENVRFIHSTARELSERSTKQEINNNTEKKFQEVVEKGKIGIIIDDAQGNITYANREFLNLFGYTSKEITNKTHNFFVHPDDYEMVSKIHKLRGEDIHSPNHYDFKGLRKDGSVLHIKIYISKIYEGNKKFKGTLSYLWDITNKKSDELKLKNSEERLKILFDYAPDAFFICDQKGNISDGNIAAEKLLGSPKNEWIGKNIINKKIISSSQLTKSLKILAKNNKGLASDPDEFTINQADGSKVVTEITTYPINLQGQDVILIIARDISNRKKTEEDILTLSYAVEQSPVSTLITNTQGIIEYGNQELLKSSGYTISEIVGQKPRIFNADKNLKSTQKNLWSHITSGKEWNGEFHNKRKDGKSYWENVHISPIKNQKGEIIKYMAIKEDITEIKKLQFLKDLLVKISNAVLVKDNLLEFSKFILKELKGIIDTNNFYIALYDEQKHLFTTPFISDSIDEEIVSFPVEKTLTGHVFQTKKSLFIDKSKLKEQIGLGIFNLIGPLCNSWIGVPLFIKNKVIGVIVIQSYEGEKKLSLEDLKIIEYIAPQISLVIDRKKADEEIDLALEKAQESDRLKSAFLANMSHEIRTPMNGILGFAELLKEPMLSGEEQQRYIDIIEKSGERMLNIINDIINISKIESGQGSISLHPVNLNELIGNLYNFFVPEVRNKGLELIYENGLSFENAIIKTDHEKLFAMMSNLIKNALKFTQKGQINFGYKKVKNEILFFVKDTGIGIPEESRTSIFERFIQVDIENRNAYQGAGLGLSISKAYVELLGGKIWVESCINSGSEFYFRIPIASTADEEKSILSDQKQEQETKSKLSALKILIVEDDSSSEYYLRTIIKPLSNDILIARTGLEAIDYCKENPDINLILMDIQLPKMNGYEATKQIRLFNKDVMIIAQTAFSFPNDYQKAMAAGCNKFITKPIKKNALIQMIQSLFQSEKTQAS